MLGRDGEQLGRRRAARGRRTRRRACGRSRCRSPPRTGAVSASIAATLAPVPLKTEKARASAPKCSREAARRRARSTRRRRSEPAWPSLAAAIASSTSGWTPAWLSEAKSPPRRRSPLTGGAASRLPFILRAASEQRKAIASAIVLGGGEGLERLVRVLLAHLRGEDRVDDDDVRGRRRVGLAEVSRRAPASRPRPRPWRRRRRRWCRPGPAPATEETSTKRPCSALGEGVGEGAGRVDARCGRAGRAATRSRRAAPSASGSPPRQPPTRCSEAVDARRSARRAPSAHSRAASSSSRSTTRASTRSSGRPSSATSASSRSWSTSVSARVAPASASRAATTGPSPPAAPAIAITRPSSVAHRAPRYPRARAAGTSSQASDDRAGAAEGAEEDVDRPSRARFGISAVSSTRSPTYSPSSQSDRQPERRRRARPAPTAARRRGRAGTRRAPSRPARRRRRGRARWSCASSPAGRSRPSSRIATRPSATGTRARFENAGEARREQPGEARART